MKLHPEAITRVAAAGVSGVQVPFWRAPHLFGSHEFTEDEVEPGAVEMPDEWFVFLDKDGLPLRHGSRQSKHLYLTRQGWEANKHRIRDAFNAAPRKHLCTTWESFEGFAERHFRRVERTVAKRKIALAKQLAALTGAVENS